MNKLQQRLEAEIAELQQYIKTLELKRKLGEPIDMEEYEITQDLITIKMEDIESCN